MRGQKRASGLAGPERPHDRAWAGAPAAPAMSTIQRVRGFGAALRHPQVASVTIVSFFLQVIHQMGQTFVPLYAANIGLNLAQIGILRATHSGANTVARPLCGELTRWLGYNRVALVGMVGICLLLMLTPWQDGFWGLAIIFVFIPILGEFLTPSMVGGASGLLIANLIQTFFKNALVPQGAALGFLIVAFVTVLLVIFRKYLRVEDVYARG